MRKWELSRGAKQVVIIESMFTSGVVTSCIDVFDKQPDGTYRVMLRRRMFYGSLWAVREEGDNIVLVAKDPILVIPWTGVILSGEQNR